MELSEADPKGLVRESYRIDGITPGECRSIFLDWALSLQTDADVPAALTQLLAEYRAHNPGHPMNLVLQDGMAPALEPKRRGGRAGKLGDRRD